MFPQYFAKHLFRKFLNCYNWKHGINGTQIKSTTATFRLIVPTMTNKCDRCKHAIRKTVACIFQINFNYSTPSVVICTTSDVWKIFFITAQTASFSHTPSFGLAFTCFDASNDSLLLSGVSSFVQHNNCQRHKQPDALVCRFSPRTISAINVAVWSISTTFAMSMSPLCRTIPQMFSGFL